MNIVDEIVSGDFETGDLTGYVYPSSTKCEVLAVGSADATGHRDHLPYIPKPAVGGLEIGRHYASLPLT